MRTVRKNRVNLKYALKAESVPIYELDDEGNVIYDDVDGEMVPRETGEYQDGYMEPVDFKGNISYEFNYHKVNKRSFGIEYGEYDCVLLMKKDELPLTETSLIFQFSTPQYLESGLVDPNSADFIVARIAPSLNIVRYLLKKTNKESDES